MFSEKDLIFKAPDAPSWQGDFQNGVLALWQQETDPRAARSFLEKLLASVQINLERDCFYAVLSPDQPAALIDAIKAKQPKQVLVFGCEPAALGLHFDRYLYEPQFFYNTWFLFADRLSVLEPDRALKTKLWTAMKQIFVIPS